MFALNENNLRLATPAENRAISYALCGEEDMFTQVYLEVNEDSAVLSWFEGGYQYDIEFGYMGFESFLKVAEYMPDDDFSDFVTILISAYKSAE